MPVTSRLDLVKIRSIGYATCVQSRTKTTEMEFEWDPEKAGLNLKKHRVSFAHASTIFGDPLSMTFHDPDHSDDEDRYITIGLSAENVLLIVSHADRHTRIRIISARRTTRRERTIYESN